MLMMLMMIVMMMMMVIVMVVVIAMYQARAKSTDALRAKSLHRMEDRMTRGYF